MKQKISLFVGWELTEVIWGVRVGCSSKKNGLYK